MTGRDRTMPLAMALETVQTEIAQALCTVDEAEIEALLSTLLRARRIFVIGTGRVGLGAQAFAMRLMHLGMSAYWIGDAITPSVGSGDVWLACSGSGETAAVRVLTQLAAQRGAEVATITRQPQGTIGRLAGTIVRLMPFGEVGSATSVSVQPMTSQFEQSLFLLLDAVVLMLMERLGQTDAMIRQRHFNLER
jgi:6-phospho-3-hexuloisomerase